MITGNFNDNTNHLIRRQVHLQKSVHSALTVHAKRKKPLSGMESDIIFAVYPSD